MTASEKAQRRRLVRTVIVLWAVVLALVAWWVAGVVLEYVPTMRTTPRFDPPVWAGQNVPNACSGGFYARDGQTVVLTVTPHCATPGEILRDGQGRFVGVLGPLATSRECPAGRFCAPSDFMTLALAPDRIPWGHLNTVDLGAGGYRTFGVGTAPLACGDIGIGAGVEINSREQYRTGKVLEIGPYQHASDTMFPCMAASDIEVGMGDSGGAVLVDGRPAGIVSRELGGLLGFTPLAEGLESLGLVLCTTADCELSPATAVQPTE